MKISLELFIVHHVWSPSKKDDANCTHRLKMRKMWKMLGKDSNIANITSFLYTIYVFCHTGTRTRTTVELHRNRKVHWNNARRSQTSMSSPFFKAAATSISNKQYSYIQQPQCYWRLIYCVLCMQRRTVIISRNINQYRRTRTYRTPKERKYIVFHSLFSQQNEQL